MEEFGLHLVKFAAVQGTMLPEEEDSISVSTDSASAAMDAAETNQEDENVPAVSRSDAPVGSTMENARQPVYGQGVVVSLLAAAFLLVLSIIAVREQETVTGIPATETTGPIFWGLAVLFTAVVAFGSQFSEISAARAAEAMGHTRAPRAYPTAWVVPVVGMAAATLLVATLHNTAMFIVGPLVALFAVGGSLLARDLLDDATDTTYRAASAVHTLVIYVTAFVGFSAVYINKMSLLAAVPLVAFFALPLIFEALDRSKVSTAQRLGYGALGAYILAMSRVFLNWWQTHGIVGGGVLLVGFYVVTGVLLAKTQRGVVSKRDLVELGVIGSVAMAILIIIR
jgi:Protein of unknown function (DUF5656)